MPATRLLPHQQEHEHPPVEPATLRRVCGLFTTGVTVITTGVGGPPAGTTVNSFTSVSLEPPLVLFCLHHKSRLQTELRASKAFAVNVLAQRQQEVARAFAGRKTADFETVPHRRAELGLPVLTEAMAHLVCRVVDQYPGGDHSIVLGEVVAASALAPRPEPLVFFDGAMGGAPPG
ncbi:flavin reductase family protein [Streptomyces aculeolatus]|jgi:3-hydroxy-9,10-secoandrosta-1,3,5(10)-triene-9,17-dione monooxygenase reductase component